MTNYTPTGMLQQFGMANQLVEADLDNIEKRYALDLGRESRQESLEESYFPQFDEDVRKEAADMSRHYEVFYCLEKTIRGLISETIKASEGANWWGSGRVPKKLFDDVTARIQKETDYAVTLRSEEPIDYTTFGELGELIKTNWDLFGGILSSARAVERVLANLDPLPVNWSTSGLGISLKMTKRRNFHEAKTLHRRADHRDPERGRSRRTGGRAVP